MIKKFKINGKIIFNKKYPDGVKTRKVNSSIIRKLGWKPKIKLKKGLENIVIIIQKIMPK